MKELQRVAGILLAFFMFAPALADAQQVSTTGSTTVDAQIQSLLSEINALQQQISTLVQSVVSSSTPSSGADSTHPAFPHATSTVPGDCGKFDRDLTEGSQGDDVTELQQLLQDDGFFSASSTGFFGPLTAKALGEFQLHFNIGPSSRPGGFFGSLTRRFLSEHCDGDHNSLSTLSFMHLMIPIGTSTPFWDDSGPDINASSSVIWRGPDGTSTLQRAPCHENENLGAAVGFFVAHTVLPPDPCQNREGGGD